MGVVKLMLEPNNVVKSSLVRVGKHKDSHTRSQDEDGIGVVLVLVLVPIAVLVVVSVLELVFEKISGIGGQDMVSVCIYSGFICSTWPFVMVSV